MARSWLVVAALAAAAPLPGQVLTFYVGETGYEIGDTGGRTALLGGVALATTVISFVRMDVAMLGYSFEGGSISDGWHVAGTRVALETGFYIQPRDGLLRPYAGCGGGFSMSRRRINDEPLSFSHITTSAHFAAGADLQMGREWGVRFDARARNTIGPGRTFDLTIGISRRIGRG